MSEPGPDEELAEMIEEASGDAYKSQLIEMLDDPDCEPPIVIFPRTWGVEIHTPEGMEYAQIVGYLQAGVVEVCAEWFVQGAEQMEVDE